MTLLNEKGIPTPLAHTMMCTPRSRMDVLTENEIDSLVDHSKLAAKYNQTIDPDSAYEMLTAKLKEAADNPTVSPAAKNVKSESSTLEKVVNNTVVKSMMRTAGTTIVRSLLGSLGLGGRSRKSSSSWF